MLGSTERVIIGILRQVEEGPIGLIHERMQAMGMTIGYTTVATALERMYHKGLVSRFQEVRRGTPRYVYRSQDLEEWAIDHMLSYIILAFGKKGLDMFVERAQNLTPEEIEALSKVPSQGHEAHGGSHGTEAHGGSHGTEAHGGSHGWHPGSALQAGATSEIGRPGTITEARKSPSE